MIDIKVINSFKELSSFPVTQSIKLVSNVQFDKKVLSNHIILFRVLPEKGMVNLSEPYSYTLSYIKESFDTVAIDVIQTQQEDGTFTLEVTPKSPLHLDSNYILYVTENISSSLFHIVKEVSKSSSSVTVEKINTSLIPSGTTYSLQVVETSKDFATKNTVKVLVGADTYTLDVKRSPVLFLEDIKIIFTDTVYVAGESFNILVKEPIISSDDQLISIKTAQSSTITPMEGITPSKSIDTKAILDFYTSVQKVQIEDKLTPNYLGRNVFSVELPEGYIVDTEQEITYAINEAFGNYLVRDLGLYDEATSYLINMYQEGNILYVEVHPSDEAQVLLNDEDLSSTKVRRLT